MTLRQCFVQCNNKSTKLLTFLAFAYVMCLERVVLQEHCSHSNFSTGNYTGQYATMIN